MRQIYPPLPADPTLFGGVILRRVLALVVDCIVIVILGLAMAVFIAIFGVFTLGLGWIAFHIIPWLPLFYYTLIIGSSGATPGQRALGLTVRQDADFSRPTLTQALVWTLLLWLSFVFACLPFLLALFNPRGRAAHDILSGLTIIKQPQIAY
jgi:uncharacterized RDD family membrane protein YckC